MRNIAKWTLSIAMGITGACNLSMAQSTGKADEILRQVVTALAANDQPTLTKLSIDQNEFKKFVWPWMAPLMTGVKFDSYYPTYQKMSQVGVSESNAALAGKKWTLVKSAVQPTRQKGKGYILLGPPVVTLRDENGQEKTVILVGGLLQVDGTFKVTTYYVSPAQKAAK
jgi:hypothetical protein